MKHSHVVIETHPLPREYIGNIHQRPVLGQRRPPMAYVDVVPRHVHAVLQSEELFQMGYRDQRRALQISPICHIPVGAVHLLLLANCGFDIAVACEEGEWIGADWQVLEAQTDRVLRREDQTTAHVLATLLGCRGIGCGNRERMLVTC